MAKITTITNPLTGQPAQVDQLEHTAQEIDDAITRALPGGAIDIALQKKANQNFFDNPLFQVNQRGFSGENTSGGYFLDRFLGYNCSYTDGVLKIRKGMFDESVNGYIIQRVESALSSELNGKVCTFSALVNDSLISGTAVYSNTSEVTYANENGVRLYTQIANGHVELVVVTDETTDKTISAVKIELGDQQTLAHQENGVWVLNEIPNYGEQLARCQRYFQLYSSADFRPAKAVDCRPTMRTDPVQGTVVVNSTTYYYNSADL